MNCAVTLSRGPTRFQRPWSEIVAEVCDLGPSTVGVCDPEPSTLCCREATRFQRPWSEIVAEVCDLGPSTVGVCTPNHQPPGSLSRGPPISAPWSEIVAEVCASASHVRSGLPRPHQPPAGVSEPNHIVNCEMHQLAELLGKRDNDALRPADVS